ncbi:MAG: hemolysin family protein [Candidatus Saccharimonas sp.]
MLPEVVSLFVSLGLVLLCGAFVAAEFALLTVNRVAVERLALQGDKGAAGILQALQSLSTQLSSVQLGITVTNLSIGFLAEPAISTLLDPLLNQVGIPQQASHMIAVVVGITLATAITMVYGELVPKYIAIISPLKIARWLHRPLLLFTATALPLIRGLNGLANYLLKLRGITPQEELSAARSADELLSIVRRSADKGTLNHDTAILMERAFNFREQTALDIMTPRVHMIAVKKDEPITALATLSKKTGMSRFPVYSGALDNVIGIARVKHALQIEDSQWAHTPVSKIMTPAAFVPSSIELGPLLAMLKKDSQHICVVVDEFGGVDGVVTLEDLLEELVGEMYDEHDPSQDARIVAKSQGVWRVSGLLRPDEISQELGLALPDEDEVETLGGLFMHEFEKVPQVGDTVSIQGVNKTGAVVVVQLVVEVMDGRRVDELEMSVRRARPDEMEQPRT